MACGEAIIYINDEYRESHDNEIGGKLIGGHKNIKNEPQNEPQNDKLDVRILEKVLSDQYITLSYKLFWFKSILHFVVLGKKKLTFEELVNEMIARIIS